MSQQIFERAKTIGLAHIREWLPGGHEESGQWVVKNPTRDDREAGSFRVNLATGAANDYADDWAGHDAVSLYAYLNGMRNIDAARDILAKYDATYFPVDDDFKGIDSWYQCIKGKHDAPEPPAANGEIARWPLEIKSGKYWNPAMWIVRIKSGDGKKDLPWTLWTDGKKYEWRPCALKGVKYPLYGLRSLAEKPNARVLLCEGQKTAAVLSSVLAGWSVVGWYGGAGSAGLTDLEPLMGREVWFSCDGDGVGRKAIKTIVDKLHVKLHLVFPRIDAPAGWDLADDVRDGMTPDAIEAFILASESAPASDENAPAVRAPLPETRPTRLDIPVDDDFREYMISEIYQSTTDKNGKPMMKVASDWFFTVAEKDPAISNSIKFDYTTGTSAMAYDSTTLYDAALEIRLQRLGILASMVTDATKKRLVDRVRFNNSRFNRVADYMDTLISEFGEGDDTILDEFMSALEFNFELKPNEDTDAFAKRCEREEKLYRELFDIFFIRMHGRIRGTRKTESGEMYGLMENDIVPILEGPQGLGKTTFCRWLACEDVLYIDLGSGLKQSFGSEETAKKVRGRLIAEIGEMKIMRNADAVEQIKSFISMKVASVNVKYVEDTKDIPMTVSFIGTSNPDQYLSDDTGNRRFWPVKMKKIDLQFLADHKDLPKRLHAHYQAKALRMTIDDTYAACKPSKELTEMMDALRQDAIITYSDYEICVKLLVKWKGNNAFGGKLVQADIERLAVEDRFMARISRRSFFRAAKDCGFVQIREYGNGSSQPMKVWAWQPGGILSDDPPF